MHDASLRPALLRWLLSQLPLGSPVPPAAAAAALDALEAHQLLSEPVPDSARAVEALGERLVALAGSHWDESRLAAVRLLGAAARDASPARFAASAERWTAPLLASLRPT